MTLETLSNMKIPPVIYARQANISNGAQQVNNGPVLSTSREGDNQNPPSKLLEQSDEPRMDTPAKSPTGAGNSAVETLATVDRTSNS
jgi:hypothetical protein